jgi:hypothetical protein
VLFLPFVGPEKSDFEDCFEELKNVPLGVVVTIPRSVCVWRGHKLCRLEKKNKVKKLSTVAK